MSMPHERMPQVIEFSSLYDVHLTTHPADGRVTVTAQPVKKHQPTRKQPIDLPFARRLDDSTVDWFSPPKAANDSEAEVRGHYYFEEFVRYVRGTQRGRRTNALWFAKTLIGALYGNRYCRIEANIFADHIAEALVAHLRYGLDEGKSDAQLEGETGGAR